MLSNHQTEPSQYRSQSAVIEPPDFEERVFFVGANGSGKTVLESALIENYQDVIVLDIKYDFPIPPTWKPVEKVREKGEIGYAVATKPPGVKRSFFERLKKDPWRSRRIIYRPEPPYDSGQWITYFLDWVFRAARKRYLKHHKWNLILVVDEGGWTAYSGAKIAMGRLAMTGRSLGIGFWVTSQRPRGIPVEVRSEAWRMYIFYLRNRKDRIEIMDNVGEIWITGDKVLEEQDISQTPESYEFAEIRRVEGGRMVYRLMPPIAYKG